MRSLRGTTSFYKFSLLMFTTLYIIVECDSRSRRQNHHRLIKLQPIHHIENIRNEKVLSLFKKGWGSPISKVQIISSPGWGWNNYASGWGGGGSSSGWKKASLKEKLISKIPKKSFGVRWKGGVGFSFGGKKGEKGTTGWGWDQIQNQGLGYGWGTYADQGGGWGQNLGWAQNYGWGQSNGWGQSQGWGQPVVHHHHHGGGYDNYGWDEYDDDESFDVDGDDDDNDTKEKDDEDDDTKDEKDDEDEDTKDEKDDDDKNEEDARDLVESIDALGVDTEENEAEGRSMLTNIYDDSSYFEYDHIPQFYSDNYQDDY